MAQKFSGQISLESNWFCADFSNIFMKQNGNFANFFGGGREGVDWNNER